MIYEIIMQINNKDITCFKNFKVKFSWGFQKENYRIKKIGNFQIFKISLSHFVGKKSPQNNKILWTIPTNKNL